MPFLEYGRHVGQLRRRRRAYAPTSNTASHDNHENFLFLYMMSMGLHLAALLKCGGNHAFLKVIIFFLKTFVVPVTCFSGHHLSDVRANCFCAPLLRTQIYATSSMSERAR